MTSLAPFDVGRIEHYASTAKFAPAADARSWRDDAACRGMTPEESERVFFPPVPDNTERTRAYDEARTYCDRCPVVDECLRDALAWNDRDGFRGGTSPGVRIKLRKGFTQVARCVECREFFNLRRRGQQCCSNPCASRVSSRRKRILKGATP